VVGKLPVTLFTSDVNRDGIEDLLIVNQNDNRVQVLVNRSKTAINFDTYSLSTGTKPESVAFADVNGDGISDLLVACSGSNTIEVFLNIAPDGLKGTTAQSFKMPSPIVHERDSPRRCPGCDSRRSARSGRTVWEWWRDHEEPDFVVSSPSLTQSRLYNKISLI
jgi:hypothetical protein